MDETVLMQMRHRAELAQEIAQPVANTVDWYIDEHGEISAAHGAEVTTEERLAVITNVLAADVMTLALPEDIAKIADNLTIMRLLNDNKAQAAEIASLREQLEQARAALGEIDKLAVNRYDSPYSSLASISNIARAALPEPPEAA